MTDAMPCLRVPNRVLLAASALALCGCASAPLHYHSLAQASAPAAPVLSPPAAFTLETPSVPRQADIPQLLIRDAKGALHLAEHQRWLSQLGEEIRAAVSQDLQTRLGMPDVSRTAVAPGLAVIRLRLDVQRFEPMHDGRVLVRAQWSLRREPHRLAAASCTSQSLSDVGAGYAALVDGYRRALHAIGADIASTLAALTRLPPTAEPAVLPCPAAADTAPDAAPPSSS